MNTDEITSDLLQSLSDRIELNSRRLRLCESTIATLENSSRGRVSMVERTLLELTDADVETSGNNVRIYCRSDKQAQELRDTLISMIPIG